MDFELLDAKTVQEQTKVQGEKLNKIIIERIMIPIIIFQEVVVCSIP